MNLNATIAAEKAEDQAALRENAPLPKHPWHPDEASWLPAGLYNGMIGPARADDDQGIYLVSRRDKLLT